MRYFCPKCNAFTEVRLYITSKVFKPLCSECGTDYVRETCLHCGQKTFFEFPHNCCVICHESNSLPEHKDILTEKECQTIALKDIDGVDCNVYIPALMRTIKFFRNALKKVEVENSCINSERYCALYPRAETMPDCRTCSSYADTHK